VRAQDAPVRAPARAADVDVTRKQVKPTDSVHSLHARYSRQSEWFYPVRSRLLRRAGVRNLQRVLDLGCGTGVISAELRRRCPGSVVAVDSESMALRQASECFEGVARLTARATELPFVSGAFDLVFTQMFFLWAKNVPAVLTEVHRVLGPNGTLIVAAEPDYGGRIEHPKEFSLGRPLVQALIANGADPYVARKMRGLLIEAGFEVQTGVHASLFDRDRLAGSLENEDALVDELGADVKKEALHLETLRNDPSLFLFMPYFWFLCRRGAGGDLQ